MFFKKREEEKSFNNISKKANAVINIMFIIMSIIVILPVLLVVIVSFSSQQSIFDKGYSFFPNEFSLEAYRYFFKFGDQIIRSYGITIFVSIFGTLFSLFISATLAYSLSRNDFRYRKIITMLLLITMLFNGGIVSSYIINTRYFGLGNSIWALILPMAFNPFYVIILRTFYKSIPKELIEAAKIDGAGEIYTFYKIILPLSKPGIATIALFTIIDYWNNWFLGMLYITDSTKYPIQTLLQSMQNSLTTLVETSTSAAEFADLIKNAPTDNGRMALTVLIMGPILFAYPFFQKYFVKGLTIGSVKG